MFVRNRLSFDRFGDDLSEVILSFLTIEDKFRFECLSKQCRRLIYNRQQSLRLWIGDRDDSISALIAREVTSVLNYFSIDCLLLERVLRKLKRLNILEISSHFIVNSQVVRLIAANCPHLKTLECSRVYISPAISDITADSIVDLGLKCGRTLKCLKFHNFFQTDSEKLTTLLSLSPELTELEVDSVDWYHSIFRPSLFNSALSSGDKLLPKLSKVKCQFHRQQDITEFQDNYHDQLVKLEMGIRAYFIKPLPLYQGCNQ